MREMVREKSSMYFVCVEVFGIGWLTRN